MTVSAPKLRATPAQIESWRRDGAVLIDGFFTPAEIAPCVADMRALYGDAPRAGGTAVNMKRDGRIGGFGRDQFRNFDDMPFDCSSALNLLALHPALIALAQAALGTSDVHLYQSHSWAKYTGEADYDQPFHCDFKNHTLSVPAEDAIARTINIMIYLTDVTDAHGAIHYVPLADSDALFGESRMPFATDEMQAPLRTCERSGAGVAGSIFAYGIDVYHRGTNLVAPDGHRFTLTASYKARGNDMIGWSAWPVSLMKPWHLIIDHATPEQLACLGIPAPGDAFWTDVTIARMGERWPNWNPRPYLDACRAT